MRTPVLIALVAVAGFAFAWMLLTRISPSAPPPKPAAVVATQATRPPVPAAAPVIAAESPPPDPAPIDTPPPAPKSAPHHEPESPPAEETGDAADGAESDAGDDATDDAGPPPAIDIDHSADLMADWLARQDIDAENNGDAASDAAKSWTAFDGEKPDPDWSQATEQQLEDALYRWIDGLPETVRDHIAIVHVECRTTLCQILAADDDVGGQGDRAQSGQEWQQAIAMLPYQPWWSELGFVDFSTSVMTSDDGSQTLYQSYLRREVKPPPPG